MNEWLNIVGDPALALVAGDGALPRGRIYPATGAAFAAATGITLDSLYLFDEASGALDDKIGTTDLAADGTPTYGVTLAGRRGIHYDSAADSHHSAVHDPGTTSMVAFCVCANPGGTTGGVMGGYDTSDALDGWIVYRTANKFEFHVRSSAAGGNKSVVASGTTIEVDKLYLVSIQIDRNASTARGRVTPMGGASEAVSVSIAGLGTLSSAGHQFGFGALNFLNPGVRVFYGGIRINADIEGANTLANLHRGLGWE